MRGEPYKYCLRREWFVGQAVSIPYCDPAWVCVHRCHATYLGICQNVSAAALQSIRTGYTNLWEPSSGRSVGRVGLCVSVILQENASV